MRKWCTEIESEIYCVKIENWYVMEVMLLKSRGAHVTTDMMCKC